MLERELGLNKKALHPRTARNLDVANSVAKLPADFFEERDIEDVALASFINSMDYCSCSCVPCRCGFEFMNTGCGDFTFGDTILRTPFSSGSVSFSYWGMEMDEEGFPMILEGHVQAFVDYAIAILKRGEMNAGQIPIQLWQVNNQQWESQSRVTRSRDNKLSNKSSRIIQYQMRNKFRFI